MRRRLATALGVLLIAVAFIGLHSSPAFAVCGNGDADFFKDGLGSGTPLLACDGNNYPNLASLSGPCSGSWNDCISSMGVNNLGATWCLASYTNANYVSVNQTWWGPLTDDLHPSVNQNDVDSSIRFYQKSPATPGGNC